MAECASCVYVGMGTACLRIKVCVHQNIVGERGYETAPKEKQKAGSYIYLEVTSKT